MIQEEGDSKMEQAASKERINSLTGLRGCMMMIIVLSHLTCLRNNYSYSFFYDQYLHNATMGVDFFFIMSGFGLMYSYGYDKRTLSLWGGVNFAVDRIKKIYPIYIVSLIICMPYELLRSLNKGYEIKEIVRNITIKIVFCITLLQSMAGMEALDRAINNVCWFLSTIFMIYLICPFMMCMIDQIPDKLINAVFIGTICVTLFVFWLFSIIQKNTFFDDLNYGSPYFRFLFVMMGMLLERIYRRIDSDDGKLDYYEYFATFWAIVWFFSRNQLKEHIYMCRMIDILICAMLMLFIALGNGKVVQFLNRRYCIMLGNISMYIFILHFPIVLYMDFIFERCRMRTFFKDMTGIVEAIFILVSTALSVWFVARRKRNFFPNPQK